MVHAIAIILTRSIHFLRYQYSVACLCSKVVQSFDSILLFKHSVTDLFAFGLFSNMLNKFGERFFFNDVSSLHMAILSVQTKCKHDRLQYVSKSNVCTVHVFVRWASADKMTKYIHSDWCVIAIIIYCFRIKNIK